MRTKHILTALALPALFAACTADEFETVNQNSGLQEERAKVAENFTLLTSGIQTRYSVDGSTGIKFNFEKGDQIGAAIVDKKEATDEKPEEFDVIYSLAGNYPFEFQGNDQWQSYTQLGIGHYLFIYPYNASDNNRSAMAYELPVVQELGEGAEGLNAAIEKGNKAIAAAVLHEGEESVDISLKNLFTYPKLTINFDNGEDVTTVSQIVLKANKGKDFIVKGGFNHKVVSEMFNPTDGAENILNSGKTTEEEYYYIKEGAKEPSMDWDKVGTYDFLITEQNYDWKNANGFIPFEEGRTSDYIIVKFPEGTKVKPAANTDNKYVEARIMMPSIADFYALDLEKNEEKNDADYILYVYTDNGVYSTPFAPASFSFSDRTDTEKIAAALTRSASNGLTLKALNANDKGEDAGTIVTTLADWNDLVARFGNTKQDQTVIIVGDDFAFDATAEWPETCTFTINADVNVKGEVAIENVTVNGTINVEEGATLTVTNTLSNRAETDNAETSIKNEGTVVIAAEYDQKYYDDNNETKKAYDGVNYIANKGNVKVAEKANAKFDLDNYKGAEVENNGTMEVSNGTGIEVAGKDYVGNHGTINNNGLMQTAGFTNATVELSKDNTKIVNIPVINNAKDARILAVSGEFKNFASLVNEGELTCRNQGGTIVNADDEDQEGIDMIDENGDAVNTIYPILDSKADALTYITTNDEGATVLVYNDDPELLTIGNGKTETTGDVKYVAGADETIDTKNSYVNVVVANGDLTIANESKLRTLIVATGTTLTWGDAKATATTAPTLANLEVEKGVLTLASPSKLAVVVGSSLKVAEGAQMTVPENVTFTLNGADYENEGRILVGGVFNATQVSEDKDNVESYGNSSDINWNDPAAEAKTAYNDALKAMVEKWMVDGSRNSWSDVEGITTVGNGNWNSGGGWSELADAAREAWNTWKKDDIASVSDFQTQVLWANKDTKDLITEIIKSYKTASYTNVLKAFNAVYPDNSWLKTNSAAYDREYQAFFKNAVDVKLSEIINASNTNMVAEFAKVAKTVTLDKVNVSTSTNVNTKALENKAVYLTLQSGIDETAVDTYTSIIPAYSYVCVYEGAEENDVMADLNSLKTELAEETELAETWKLDLTKLVNVQKAVSKLYELSQGDDLFVSTKIKATCIDEYATNVMNWKFTNKQISYLSGKAK